MKRLFLFTLICLSGCSDPGREAGESAAHGESSSTVSGKNKTFSLAFNLSLKSLFKDQDEVRPSTAEFIFFNHGLDVTIGLPESKNKAKPEGE